MLKPIALATAVAGTLDIMFAMILTALFGREIGNMLRFVASGPFPQATDWSTSGALLGLLVHFALMAIMVALFVLAVRRRPSLNASPIVAGALYGLITYVVMNLIIVPLRFPGAFPPKPMSIATQLFAHIVLVGLPIAWIAARAHRNHDA